MISYTTIVNDLKSNASSLTSVNNVDFGSIDKLDANAQNVVYPYVFFRPLTSRGVPFGDVMVGIRSLQFEMYVMDIPKVTDEDMVDVMSNCEQIGYDILSLAYDGSQQSDYTITNSSMIPLFEAFQDRVGGWVFNLDVQTSTAGLTSCNRV